MLGASFYGNKTSHGNSIFGAARRLAGTAQTGDYPVQISPHSVAARRASRRAASEWAPKAEPAASESYETETPPPAVAGSPACGALIWRRSCCRDTRTR